MIAFCVAIIVVAPLVVVLLHVAQHLGGAVQQLQPDRARAVQQPAAVHQQAAVVARALLPVLAVVVGPQRQHLDDAVLRVVAAVVELLQLVVLQQQQPLVVLQRAEPPVAVGTSVVVPLVGQPGLAVVAP